MLLLVVHHIDWAGTLASQGCAMLNKAVRAAMAAETEIYTADSRRFIHGAGVKAASKQQEAANGHA